LEISNSELNAFYLELIIIIFILHKNGDIYYFKVEVIGRSLSLKGSRNPVLFNFSGFIESTLWGWS
jgi:hypothetical protein